MHRWILIALAPLCMAITCETENLVPEIDYSICHLAQLRQYSEGISCQIPAEPFANNFYWNSAESVPGIATFEVTLRRQVGAPSTCGAKFDFYLPPTIDPTNRLITTHPIEGSAGKIRGFVRYKGLAETVLAHSNPYEIPPDWAVMETQFWLDTNWRENEPWDAWWSTPAPTNFAYGDHRILSLQFLGDVDPGENPSGYVASQSGWGRIHEKRVIPGGSGLVYCDGLVAEDLILDASTFTWQDLGAP